MTATPALRLAVAEQPEARILRLMKERDDARRRVAMLDQAVSDACRDWSFANDYCVPLRPEAVKLAIEGGR